MYRKVKVDTGTMIMAVLAIVVFFVVVSYIVKGILWLLFLASPALLGLAIYFDHKTVVNYGKGLITRIKNNPPFGLVVLVLNIVAFPIVFAYLAARAYLTKKVRGMQEQYETQQQGEFVDFEVIDEKPLEINQPPIRPRPEQRKGNDYDDMFE